MSLSEQQVIERVTGIGGSQAAAALGLSPYQSPLGLFLDKINPMTPGYVPRGPTPAMHWGTLLEPVIRQEYAQLTGRTVRVPGSLRHAKHTFMIGHVDGITHDGRLFEAKTARTAEGWGEPDIGPIPHHYEIQVQHYLAITGLKVADLAVLIGASDFRIYEVPADPNLQELIIEGEAAFWKCVQTRKAPPADFDTGDVGDLMQRLYPGTNGKTVTASEREAEFRRVFEFAKNAEQNYAKVAEGAKMHLLYTMGEAARMTFPDGVQLARKVINRKGYTVNATQYVDARFSQIKEPA